MVHSEVDMAAALFRHIQYATNNGKVRPAITIFRQERNGSKIQIWNHQLIRYAGYERKDVVVGDPASIRLTKACYRLGSKGNETQFDVLPIVIQIDDRIPRWFDVPEQYVLALSSFNLKSESLVHVLDELNGQFEWRITVY
nr:nitric oxide synthase oxygenase [Paenibacillus piri]